MTHSLTSRPMDGAARDRILTVASAKAELLKQETQPIPEAKLCLQVILPIVRELGWNDEAGDVEPQAAVGADSPDYALLGPPGPKRKRVVLIEVKGTAEKLVKWEDQLGKYIGRTEAPLAVLTNGREWWLYLVEKVGKMPDRRFAELDLVQDPPRFAEVVTDVLAKASVWTGEQALQRARGLLKAREDAEQWRDALPKVWEQLLSEPDDDLVRLLQEKASSDGATPPPDAVRVFLADVRRTSTASHVPAETRVSSRSTAVDRPPSPRRTSGTGAVPPPGARPKAAWLAGQRIEPRCWKDVLVAAATYAAKKGRLPVPYTRGRRVIVAETVDAFRIEAYRTGAAELPNGAFLDTQWNGRDCLLVGRELLDAAGLQAVELRVEWE